MLALWRSCVAHPCSWMHPGHWPCEPWLPGPRHHSSRSCLIAQYLLIWLPGPRHHSSRSCLIAQYLLMLQRHPDPFSPCERISGTQRLTGRALCVSSSVLASVLSPSCVERGEKHGQEKGVLSVQEEEEAWSLLVCVLHQSRHGSPGDGQEHRRAQGAAGHGLRLQCEGPRQRSDHRRQGIGGGACLLERLLDVVQLLLQGFLGVRDKRVRRAPQQAQARFHRARILHEHAGQLPQSCGTGHSGSHPSWIRHRRHAGPRGEPCALMRHGLGLRADDSPLVLDTAQGGGAKAHDKVQSRVLPDEDPP